MYGRAYPRETPGVTPSEVFIHRMSHLSEVPPSSRAPGRQI